jgi:hypothetical protein
MVMWPTVLVNVMVLGVVSRSRNGVLREPTTAHEAFVLPCRGAVTGIGTTTNCTFYVSSSSPHASDANSGTDASRPLATLGGVMTGGAAGLLPGDRVLLRRGDEWDVGPDGVTLTGCTAPSLAGCPSHCVCTVDPAVLGAGSSPAAPVLIGAYGDAAAHRPLLRGVLAPGSHVLGGVNLQQIQIVSVGFTAAENGVSLRFTDRQGRYTGASFRDCDFHDIQWANFTSNITVIYGGGNAIQLDYPFADDCQVPGAPCPTPLLADLEISNCIFERVDMAFASRVARTGLPLGVRDGVSTHNAKIHSNLFVNCSFNTVMVDGATQMSVQHNVFLRGQPRMLFGYGTTDVIIAYADDSTIVANNDFTLRGEHAGDPDGCPIDLETDSKNLILGPNNTFYKSVAASVNVFGHTFAGGPPKTSKNLTIIGNVLVEVGCLQGLAPYKVGSSDRGAIAFDLPNGTGVIKQNLIVKCPDPSVPLWGGPAGYTDGFRFVQNTIVTPTAGAALVVDMPTITHDDESGSKWPHLHAECSTPEATLRYTLDGSRPTEHSSVWPPSVGDERDARTAVLIRAFKDGLFPSSTNGLVV